jgi:hypothetical protein
MKKIFIMAVAVMMLVTMASEAFCEIRYINSYMRSNGTVVRGHYRDVSCDGNPYNNANYLGYNN